MNNDANQLKDLFDILHDGRIEEYQYKNKTLSLKVEITYLTRLLNPGYSFLRVVIHGCDDIYFEPWEDNVDNIQNLKEIFNRKLVILSCELNEAGLIEITCDYHGEEAHYSGGVLFISAQGFEVFDEVEKEVGIAKLEEICNQYWDDWEKKNKKRML